jgi:hypothetical protein
MPYMTVGEDGQLAVDPFTKAAENIFDGLGKRRKGFFKKRIARKLKVGEKLMKLTPHGLLMMSIAKKVKRRKRRQRGGVAEGDETAVYAPCGPIPEESPEGYTIPSEPPPQAVYSEAAPPPVEERVPPPEAAAAVPMYEPEGGPPPIEHRSSSGYTISPGAEPWARTPEGGTPEQGSEMVEAEEAPEAAVEGVCCGAYILTSPSPKQRAYMHKRSMAAALWTPPYKGLGGEYEAFWYEPETKFQRKVPVSAWPPAASAVHRGSSVWGDAMREAHRAVDPFAFPQRSRVRRERAREAPGRPF